MIDQSFYIMSSSVETAAQQKAQEELVKIKMVRDAEKEDKARLFQLRTKIVKGIDPYESDAAELQLHHLEHNRKVMEKYLENNQ